MSSYFGRRRGKDRLTFRKMVLGGKNDMPLKSSKSVIKKSQLSVKDTQTGKFFIPVDVPPRAGVRPLPTVASFAASGSKVPITCRSASDCPERLLSIYLNWRSVPVVVIATSKPIVSNKT